MLILFLTKPDALKSQHCVEIIAFQSIKQSIICLFCN